MEWLENITDNTILRNILGAGPQPNKVVEVKPEQYEKRRKLREGDGIVLYSPNDEGKEKYEIVIEKNLVQSSPCAYRCVLRKMRKPILHLYKILSNFYNTVFFFCSIFRSDDLETAEELFAVYKEKVPYLIGISKDVRNIKDLYLIQEMKESSKKPKQTSTIFYLLPLTIISFIRFPTRIVFASYVRLLPNIRLGLWLI